MSKSFQYDAIVIGSGPNGLAAAIRIAQAGRSVIVYESKSTIGGGLRSAELTLPGFVHDVCSAIHPLGMGSPFFLSLPLQKYGLEWIHPPAPLAHPFDDGTAAVLWKSIEATASTLGADSKAYKQLMTPFVNSWPQLAETVLSPLQFPKHLWLSLRFARFAIRSAKGLANSLFQTPHAKAFFAGLAAHSVMPIEDRLTAAFGLILGILGHAVGWPMPRGGSQNIANALAAYFLSLGGKICTDTPIENLDALPSSEIILCDVTPQQLLKIAGHRLPERYKETLKSYRYGPGVFKIDWALNSPVPWKSKDCLQAGTVHIGGSMKEIQHSEKEPWLRKNSEQPFIIFAQQSLFDPSRAPPGKHTGWGYCHVPNGSTFDMTDRMEAQIERFAPGFKDCILARSCKSPLDMEAYNANYIGGDINGGVQDIYQLFSRPRLFPSPYSTPIKGLYLCSSSTPPGGGVHGMCGYHAACAALKDIFL